MEVDKDKLPDEVAAGRMTMEQAWERLAELDAADELAQMAEDDGFYERSVMGDN